MALFANVSITNLAGAKRLDADYYKSTYDNKPKVLHKKLELGQICSTIKKGIFDIKADAYCDSKNGVPFVRISDLHEGLIDSSRIVYIPHGIHQQEYKTIMYNGDFVLSKTAKPAASLVIFNECNISQDIIGMTLKQEYIVSIVTGYIVVYLNTVYGLAQMERWFQGNIQKHLGLEGAKRITIPLFSITFQHVIDKMLRESQICVVASNDLYGQAQNILVRNADFNDYNIDKKCAWYSMLMETQKSFRLDPEFWKLNTANKNETKKLIDFVQPITAATTIYYDSHYNYIEIGDVDVGSGEITWTNRLGSNLPANAKIFVSGGELIISKVRPTRGAIAIIPDKFEGICSSAFVVGKVKSPYREVIQVFLRSDYGKILLGRPQKGSSYPTITDKEVLDIKAPIIEMDKMNEISVLVQQSHQLRLESKRLLKVAKKAVEIAIEESEEKAMQYLNENQATSIEY